MARYLPFDMLREGGDQLPDLMAEAEQNRIAEGRLNQEAVLDQSGFTRQSPQDAVNMRRAGMFEQPDGTFIDPYRLVAQERRSRINLAQKRNEEQKQAIADSMLFKVGDTLADTGRMFLSPLFWLKGEDTTKYDPSARLKTGYRNQFESLEVLRETNVEKFLASRNQRLSAAATLSNNQRSQQIQATSPFEKELMGFAAGSGRAADYNDPAMRQDLTEQLRLDKGLAMQYGDRVVDRTTHTFVTGRAEKFAQQVSGYKQALQGYNRLKSSLEAGDAFGDIAAIFGFMKMLDPTSVVREGEFAVAASAGGLFARMQIIMKQAEDGQRLTPTMRQEIMDLSNELVETYNDAYKSKRDGYQKEFKRYQYQDDEINELLGSAPNIDTASSVENVDYTLPDETFTGLGIDPDALMKGPEGYKSNSTNPEVPTYMMRAQ